MRTPIIIIALIVIVISTAFVFRLATDKESSDDKSANKKEKSKDNDKKEKTETNDSGDSGVSIVNQWDVPGVLQEISAHAYLDGQRFACVQDELGKIFIYNTKSEEIEKEISFAGAGDYEGLALNGETAWVLRADGQIFEVSNYNGAKPVINEYKTGLTAKHDTEGLAFDKVNNRLLISIKGNETESKDYKGIYAFDLTSKKMASEPVFKIDLHNEVFSGSTSSKKKKGSTINPSEIAIHPVSGDIYVTDGGKPRLLIMNKQGEITSLIQLGGAEFSQPEGIAFSPEGKLYISNEGSKNAGNILEVSIK